MLLGGAGPPDTTRLESSTDLQIWHPLTNPLGGFNGSSTVCPPTATHAPKRFNRAVAP